MAPVSDWLRSTISGRRLTARLRRSDCRAGACLPSSGSQPKRSPAVLSNRQAPPEAEVALGGSYEIRHSAVATAGPTVTPGPTKDLCLRGLSITKTPMQIHVARNGQQLGQYSVEEVNRQLADGTLSPTDLGWHEGLAGWAPLSSIAGLTLPAAAASPAMPISPPPAALRPRPHRSLLRRAPRRLKAA